ncbi:XIAP-associated factor 1-like protein [Cinnamomum micranthum f. kanehirae]|uniref:XIAP-associated factor 1-like protein n=1 Tax=Cinnamomum micranthum f. kanehirae TaxID=337451 RepID=A0A3S3NXZ1_9MAGN|nr:XIAP-associated factor 1-like protein [Cinnamomum micranthum f. kanehirae]
MAIASEFSTSLCSHCEKAIPVTNIDLHYAHCSRNLERCKICRDMIPKKHAEEHYLSTHAPVACSQCSVTVEREVLALHKDESCPKRIITCEYCDFPLPAVDLIEHQEVCGNRTEYCDLCNKYVRQRERNDHEALHSRSRNIAESSRNENVPERVQAAPRRPAHDLSRRHVLFTIAVTGVAVVIGSMFLQRSADSY